MTSNLDWMQLSAAGHFLAAAFCAAFCRAELICCVFFPRAQCCARRESRHVQTAGAVIHISRCHVLSSFVSLRRRRSAPPTRCLFMCSHPDCLTLSALASCLQFTLCNLSPVCLRRLLARSDGRWGGVSAPAKPIQPGDEAGLFGEAGGRWQKWCCLIEYSVFKLHTRRRA